jgi:hypothetical protein
MISEIAPGETLDKNGEYPKEVTPIETPIASLAAI